VAEGEYVRLRSPQNIVNELKYLTIEFPSITECFLEVETLGADITRIIHRQQFQITKISI
jgi:hypothetical protein